MAKLTPFKPIEGYEGIYDIWRDGRVWSYKSGKFLKACLDKYGYQYIALSVNASRKNKYIHRLIALHFIPNPKNYREVDHIDQDKLNNSIENLRWVTCQQNNTNKLKTSKGYYWCKTANKWYSYIDINRKRTHLGVFDKEEDAREAYVNAHKTACKAIGLD